MGDWTNLTYIFSQVFVLIACGCFGFTYLIKKRSLMLLVIILSNTLIGIGYVLLSAWVGVGMCVVAIARDFVSYFINSKRKEEDKNKITKMDWVLLTIWTTAILVITMFTQNGFWTWFAFFGTLGYTISIWQKNVLVYKYLGAVVCIFWIIYNINEKNFFGIILEFILLIIVIVGLVAYYKSKKTKVTKVELQKNINNNLN